jgi:hypothetical protein
MHYVSGNIEYATRKRMWEHYGFWPDREWSIVAGNNSDADTVSSSENLFPRMRTQCHLLICNYNCNDVLEQVFRETAFNTNLYTQMEFTVYKHGQYTALFRNTKRI